MMEAFYRISGQNIGITVVIAFSVFFFLWFIYGLLIKFTRVLPSWWSVPGQVVTGSFDAEKHLLRFATEPVTSQRFSACEIFLQVISADTARKNIYAASLYEDGHRVQGGNQTIETWENIEQICYRLRLQPWQPGQPLLGTVPVPERVLNEKSSTFNVVNRFSLICRHPVFGESVVATDLDLTGRLAAAEPTVTPERIESVPYYAAGGAPYLRFSAIIVLMLLALIPAGTFLGLHLRLAAELINQEKQWATAYAMLASGEPGLAEWIRQTVAPSALAQKVNPEMFYLVNEELPGFEVLLKQRSGAFDGEAPSLSSFWTPPVQWLARAEYFLHKGQFADAGEQFDVLLERSEYQPFAVPVILRILKQLEESGKQQEAMALGKVVMHNLKSGSWTVHNCPPLKPLFDRLALWFAEDPAPDR